MPRVLPTKVSFQVVFVSSDVHFRADETFAFASHNISLEVAHPIVLHFRDIKAYPDIASATRCMTFGRRHFKHFFSWAEISILISISKQKKVTMKNVSSLFVPP